MATKKVGDQLFKAPFPWFGGKSRAARVVWKHFGDVKGYIEPFFGSGAMLLNRPQPFKGTETVNDFNGMVANFWRATKGDPDKVAAFADWPVNENDLHARHAWLVGQKETLQAKLEGDPEYFDAKIAGWWVWGMGCWIGGSFCGGKGPWKVVDGELKREGGEGGRQTPELRGKGITRKMQELGWKGISRQIPQLKKGNGVHSERGRGGRGLLEWMRALSERFNLTRICCGDWTRVCGGRKGDAISHFGDPCGIFLDPPYADTAGREANLYATDSLTVAHAVREWCVAHGDDKRLRIALAGYEGEHKMPASWKVVSWKASGGYSSIGSEGTAGRANTIRERLWFSPHCVR